MNPVATTPSTSLSLPQWCTNFWIRCYFKFILPRIKYTVIEGIRLDLQSLSLKVRNRILNNGYEESERIICAELLDDKDAVLELGGGLGFIGLFCQRKLGIKRYVTVEANPHTVKVLERNYEINGIKPIIWNMAAGEKNGMVTLDVGGDFWENSVVYGENKASATSVTVPSATIATLLAKAGPEINTLIIDIEGGEFFMDFSTLPQGIKKIIIEMHFSRTVEINQEQFISKLAAQGFRVARQDGDTLAFVRN